MSDKEKNGRYLNTKEKINLIYEKILKLLISEIDFVFLEDDHKERVKDVIGCRLLESKIFIKENKKCGRKIKKRKRSKN